jgi:2-polyprenyl-6-hydroxyphenyl methylase/3-demethylubiquinone-9 3-methyltransferase
MTTSARALTAFGFLDANRRASRRLAARLPHARKSLTDAYLREVTSRLRPGMTVANVGTGGRCDYARRRPAGGAVRIVGVDVSQEAMAGNADVDERRVADVVRHGMPFADGELDMVTSRSVIEHLDDVERFIAESARALRPGGWSVHILPGRFGVFALINGVLPHRLARRLLFTLRPSMIGIGGYPVVYDRCSARELRALFERHGHDVVLLRAGYSGAQYFEFLFPLFLLVTAWEGLCALLGAEQLAPRLLIVARRR